MVPDNGLSYVSLWSTSWVYLMYKGDDSSDIILEHLKKVTEFK